MAADDLTLERGTRLVHIGPHKTGSSALQGALHLARPRLADRGVFYPGNGRHALLPVLAVTAQPPLLGEAAPSLAKWDRLVSSVRAAGDQRVVVSSEFFAGASDEQASRVVADLGQQVHIAVTLRPLHKILPSQWQQYIQNGFQFSYGEWLTGILSQPPNTPTPGFWRRHRHDELISRWAAAAGTENLTVIVLDESDRGMLLRTFEALLGLPERFLIPESEAENRSLTQSEVEVVRMINQEFKRHQWPDASYAKFMRYGAIRHLKIGHQPAPDEARITTPAWALDRAVEIGAEMAKNIVALGVRVVGDLSSLGSFPADSALQPHGSAAGLIPAQAQAAEAVTLLSATADVRAAPSSTGAPANLAGAAMAADPVLAGAPGQPEQGASPAGAEPGTLMAAEAAVQALIGAFLAGGVAGRTAEEAVRGISATSITRVLVRRVSQRLRSKLRLR